MEAIKPVKLGNVIQELKQEIKLQVRESAKVAIPIIVVMEGEEEVKNNN